MELLKGNSIKSQIYYNGNNIDVNKTLFNYIYRPYVKNNINDEYPPLVVQIEDNFFQLNKFNMHTSYFIYLGTKTYEESLNISINVQSSINIVELSNIITIAENLDVDIKSIHIFKDMNIKGDKLLIAIKKLKYLSDALKNYIISKDLSYKYIIMLTNLNGKLIKLLTDYISKKNPTLSDFRTMLTLIYDYKSLINIDYFDESQIKEIVEKRNIIEKSFIEDFNKFKEGLKPINVENSDNFETSKLLFSFISINFNDFEKKLRIILDKKTLVKEFFCVLENYDIR